jgi:hypothetical protein
VRPIEDPGRWTISYLGLVATDGSEEAGLASRVAAHLASRTVSELYVIHVFRGDVGNTLPGRIPHEGSREVPTTSPGFTRPASGADRSRRG